MAVSCGLQETTPIKFDGLTLPTHATHHLKPFSYASNFKDQSNQMASRKGLNHSTSTKDEQQSYLVYFDDVWGDNATLQQRFDLYFAQYPVKITDNVAHWLATTRSNSRDIKSIRDVAKSFPWYGLPIPPYEQVSEIEIVEQASSRWNAPEPRAFLVHLANHNVPKNQMLESLHGYRHGLLTKSDSITFNEHDVTEHKEDEINTLYARFREFSWYFEPKENEFHSMRESARKRRAAGGVIMQLAQRPPRGGQIAVKKR